MNTKSFFIVFLVLAVLTGCTNTKIDQLAQLDPYQKTINMPASVGKLTSNVHDVLTQNNWQVGDSNQPLANARYSMSLSYDQVNVCAPRFDPMYDYDMSIKDNKMGGRVYAMHGRDCQHTILDHLNAFLENKKL